MCAVEKKIEHLKKALSVPLKEIKGRGIEFITKW